MNRNSKGKRPALIALALGGVLVLSACANDADPYDGYGPNYGYVGPGYFGGYYDNDYYYDRDGRRHRRHHDRDHDHGRNHGHDKDGKKNWRDHDGDRDRVGDRNGERGANWPRRGDRVRSTPHGDANSAPAQVTQPDATPGSRHQAPQTIRQQENLRSGGSTVGGGNAPAPRVAPRGSARGRIGHDE